MRTHLHILHSLNGGYVDTLGFVAMQGLFAAHVTGNIITLTASFVSGQPEAIAKVLALPVYCASVLTIRALSLRARDRTPDGQRNLLLSLNVGLLTLASILALWFGPFGSADAPMAVLTGMVLVAGMSVQNMVRRLHLPTAPPTTVMTGTITQLMMDTVDAVAQRRTAEARSAIRRASLMARGLGGFAIGAALAGAAVITLGHWAFALPPVIAAAAMAADLRMGEAEPATP
ncbi:MAG: DUF1275 family protein [Acetobacteraceae bacterium]